MIYKVFLVEDEILTREGIRDNVQWKADGFEFSGEASDGDMALPLIQTIKPDLLVTDIKMPFMDGLELCRIVRERMPWIKIIILSGHDEFEYAQEAVKLGVDEYLLKPITVQEMHKVLKKIARELDQERREQEYLKKMQEQLEENQELLREKLLLDIVTGALSSPEAIEKGQSLGLDLVARYYLIVILRFLVCQPSDLTDQKKIQEIENHVSGLMRDNPDIFVLRRDREELVLLLKGNNPQFIEEERELLFSSIRKELENTRCNLMIGVGTLKDRIGDIYQSFLDAFVQIHDQVSKEDGGTHQGLNNLELHRMNRSAVEEYLTTGGKEDFDAFFNAYIQPLDESLLQSFMVRNYIFMDVVLGIAKLLNDLGGNISVIIPELDTLELIMSKITTIGQLKEHTQSILFKALEYRDGQNRNPHARIIRQAKEYIEQHFMDADLSLNQLASLVNLSSSHFSMVFSQETTQTFKEYLTDVRIHKAKELLRTTTLNSNDISFQVGFNDPHYFSFVFKKNTGLSPTEFRSMKHG
jgi:two-component system response regulator YesN